MKNLILVLTVLIFTNCKQKTAYTLTGELTYDSKEEWVYLLKAFSDPEEVDSAKIENGKFKFSGEIDHPEIYALLTKGDAFMFILEHGELQISIDQRGMNNFGDQLTGGKYNQELTNYFKERDKIDMNDFEERSKLEMNYMKSHVKSPVSMYIFMWTYYSLPLEQQKEILDTLSALQNMTIYQKIMSDYEREIALNKKTPFIDNNPKFSNMGLDPDQKSIIHQLVENNKGKVLYIDAWSTDCPPCVKEFPYSNELNDKLKDNVEFIYLCVGPDNETDWKKMVNKYKLSGQHYFLSQKQVQNFYTEVGSDIIRMPRYVIVNNKGEITNNDAPGPSNKEVERLLKKLIN